jgi:hypothetical protein
MKLDFIDEVLLEVAAAPARTPHPEDAIFEGSAAAAKMLEALEYLIKNPQTATIKWDGIPALVFGRNVDGQLIVADKYMFDKPNGRVTSAQGWVDYDQARGANRGDLYQRIANVWTGLDQAVGNSSGFFWGDLLWSNRLEPVNGMFVFKPNIVEYRVPVKSPLGQQITGTQGGVVVHTYLADEQARPQPWNGQGLRSNNQVAIITPNAGIGFRINDPVRIHNQAVKAVTRLGPVVDKFIAGLDGVARTAIKTYMNKRITGQTSEELVDWLANNISGVQYKKLVGDNYSGYLYREQKGLNALFAVWNALYEFKTNLAQQLEQQVQGMQQFVGGRAEGEGFVFSTPQGPIKLVQRGTFSAALFAK